MKWQGLRVGLVGPLPPPAGGMAMQTRQLAELLRGRRRRRDASAGQRALSSRLGRAASAAARGVQARSVSRPAVALRRRVDLLHVMANSGWSWHLVAAPAIWIARARGVPVIVNYRGGEAAAFLERSVRWVRPSLAAANLLAVPSEFLSEVFGRHRIAAQVACPTSST